ncbi:Polygalacturonase 3 [Mycena venus]|uniref:Polygalacturonase 3 n=1 Tax=Mycena venus TaxID=2733690 RepID=A0A8H7D2U2_9AGAR|nr:Polygalacturonase 3 [Mycena venus]
MAAEYTTRAMLSKRVAASLDELYREVEFRFLNLEDGLAKRLWKRAVADRVRVLSIGPYFVCDALDSNQSFPRTAQIVRSLLARFRNLEQYHILWHERPSATLRSIVPKYDFSTLCLASTFLAAPFSSAQYLRILTVECSLDKAEHLLLPTIVLPRLEEFILCIRDDHAGDLDAAGYIMVHHLARFLNNTHRTLRSFSFETSLSTDFSPLFSALGFFAHLSSVTLSIPTSDPHLGDPSAVKGFLQLHSDVLERLSLRGFCTNISRRTGMADRWLSQCLTGVTFASLNTLNLGTSFLPSDVILLCVRQDKRLETLSVGVTCLCPELVDMLAEHLPGLTKLNLRIRYVAPHRLEAPKPVGRLGASRRFLGSTRKQTDSQLLGKERFCAEMSTRKYEAWKLRDVGVWMFTKKLQSQAFNLSDRCTTPLQYTYGLPGSAPHPSSSTTMMSHSSPAPSAPLPSEIWLQVADYLPPQMVGDLYSVNRQWFDISMNARYRQVSFAFLNRAMLRDLERLRDPAVARRVRTLHVHPYFVKEIMERSQEIAQINGSANGCAPQPHSLRGKFKLARGLFRDQKRLARGARTSALHEFGSPAELIQTLAEVISGLPHVTHYHIAWSGLHTIHDLPVPFLTAAFRPSVLQLTLEISLEKTVELLRHTADLENLEELDLFLRLDHVLPAEAYEQILVDHLAPAINRLHTSLQKLSLRLCEPLDISPLFDSLRFLPVLDCLSLSIPMARPHLGHPSGLGKFLNRHRQSLRHLILRATELSGDGLMPAEDPLSEWINDALSFVTGTMKLRSLEASLTLFPIEAAAMVLGRFARTLHSLTLTGRHLPYDRVDELLGAVRRAGAGRLNTLRLGAVTLSPELIDLLAEKLPSLRRLELLVRDVVGSEGDLPLYYGGIEQDDSQIGNFFVEMEQRRYPDWGLRTISLSRSSFPYRLQYQTEYGDLFAECIPSIVRA